MEKNLLNVANLMFVFLRHINYNAK